MKKTNDAVVAFDLETIANRSIIKLLPEVTAKGTLKDPKKIEADIAEKKRNKSRRCPSIRILILSAHSDGQISPDSPVM